MYETHWCNPFTPHGGRLPDRTFATLEEAMTDMKQDPPPADLCGIWDTSTETIVGVRIVQTNGRSTYWTK